MDLSLTTTITSVTEPGLTFTLRKITPPQRARLEFKLVANRVALRDLQAEKEESTDRLRVLLIASGVTPEGKPMAAEDPTLITREMIATSQEREIIGLKAELYERGEIAPAFIEAALVSATSDGKDVPLETLLAAASDTLYTEIYQHIVHGAYLDGESTKNSQPSTTSNAAQAAGEGQTSNAEAVKSGESTPQETVISISLSA